MSVEALQRCRWSRSNCYLSITMISLLNHQVEDIWPIICYCWFCVSEPCHSTNLCLWLYFNFVCSFLCLPRGIDNRIVSRVSWLLNLDREIEMFVCWCVQLIMVISLLSSPKWWLIWISYGLISKWSYCHSYSDRDILIILLKKYLNVLW